MYQYSWINMILYDDRWRIFACGGLTYQWFNSTILSPHHHHRHPTFKLCDHPILSCQTKNYPRKYSGNLLNTFIFRSSCLRCTTLWTGTSTNSISRSGYSMAVYLTTRKTTSFLTSLKLIIFCQINPTIFFILSTLLPLFLLLISNIIPYIYPCSLMLTSCLSVIW